MTSIFVFGKQMLKSHYLQVWYLRDHQTRADAGVQLEQEFCLLVNQMELLIFGILWINLINGQCSILSGQLEFPQ